MSTTAIDTHLTAYTEPDADRRRTLIEQAWAADGRLLDPPLTGEGHEGIAAAADALLSHYPGHAFRRTSDVDEHHGTARYAWQLVDPDGGIALTGIDVADLDDEGRLVRVVGFFGELAADRAG
jgi:hypothetical protein